MNTLNAMNLLDAIVPISRFNKGEANKIFSDVKKYGTRIVVKNNVPECVLISPKEYQAMMEEYENAVLLAKAGQRLADNSIPVSQEDVLNELGINESELDNIDVDIE